MNFPTDIEIAEAADMLPIKDVAAKLNIPEEDLEYYGRHKAKIDLKYSQMSDRRGKLILVSAINPTPAGEGKTTVSVGLCDGLNKIGKNAVAVLREPSLGPVFGIKGGAAGGGCAQVVPMVDINLHFTGDFSAIEKANNLLSAMVDNELQNPDSGLKIDPRTITWKRVMDMNDRALRKIVIGLGGTANGVPREENFNITPASEVMAILCLAQDFADLKTRLGNIFIGYSFDKTPIYARDLRAENAMAILLKDAIKPNLVQTLEGNPAILHGGPFANIAQGTNSLIATKTGLALADYVVTEAGFGADLGAEKFLHIKCRAGGLRPDAFVIVATLRALRAHGGAKKAEYGQPNMVYVQKGFANLQKHIENALQWGLKPIVALNKFDTDSEEEIQLIRDLCQKFDVIAVLAEEFTKGGEGMRDLANAVVMSAESGENNYQPLYDLEESVQQKIETIARKVYGAATVEYSPKAKADLKVIQNLGLDKMAVCMAKTQKSLSDNEKLTGRPENFTITVREFEFAAGAGFIIPILGDMMRMPGLPKEPAAIHMTIDDHGKISGLS